eukprot:COSAG01_NODE_19_length_39011_cov_38.134968_12_plen_57_part_00
MDRIVDAVVSGAARIAVLIVDDERRKRDRLAAKVAAKPVPVCKRAWLSKMKKAQWL